MKRKKAFEPYSPTERTENGYLSVLMDTATLITLDQLSITIGLPKDSIIRAGLNLAIERYGRASADVHDLMNRSARHYKPDDPTFWGRGDHEREQTATLPKGTQSFKIITEVKGSESK